jgi:hypothetical protein
MFYKTAISLLVLMAVLAMFISPSPTWYLRSFAHYNKTFGALGAVVALMLWFYVSAMAIILGAELNSEILKSSGRVLPAKEKHGQLLNMTSDKQANRRGVLVSYEQSFLCILDFSDRFRPPRTNIRFTRQRHQNWPPNSVCL